MKTIRTQVEDETHQEAHRLATGQGLLFSAWLRKLVEAAVKASKEYRK